MSRMIKNTLLVALVAGCFSMVNQVSAETNMIHRWSFNEVSGTTVADSIGSADGTLRQLVSNSVPQGTLPTLDGTEVTLDGDAGYVDLPNGVFSGLSNVTIEIWFRFLDNSSPTNDWANLLCAGAINNNANTNENALDDTGAGPDSLRNAFTGGDYWGADGLFITPMSGAGQNARFAISDDTNATFNFERPQLDSLAPLFSDADLGTLPNYIAVTYGPEGQRLFVFNDEQAYTVINSNDYVDLSSINDINVWLGRSMYGGDPMLNATVNELRIHDTILSAAEVTASYFFGATDPNVVGYDPGTLLALSADSSINPNMFQGELQRAQVIASYSNLGDIPIYPADLDFMTSDDTNVVVIVGSNLDAVGGGSATVTFALGGITNSVTITVQATDPVLVHRWSFNTNATDSVGAAHGVLQGSAVVNTNTGQLELDGTGGTYMDIPGAPTGVVVSSFTNISVESWATPDSTTVTWSTLIGFGKTNTTDANLMAQYIIMQTHRGNDVSRMSISYSDDGSPWGEESGADGPEHNDNQQHHYLGIIGPSTVQLYVDGILTGETALSDSNRLTNLSDEFGRIGFGYPVDGVWSGEVNEVRLHEGVMTPLNIALSIAAGPDELPVAPGLLLSVDVISDDIMVGDPNPTLACLCGTFENVSGVNLLTLGGTLESSDTNVITVAANGNLTGVGTNGQSATISGNYFAESVTPQLVNILAPTGLVLNVSGPLTAGSFSVLAGLEASFDSANLQDVNVAAFNGVVWNSSDPSVATVSADGFVSPNGPGTTEIVATYGGLSATNSVSVTMNPTHTAATLLHRYSFSEAADATNAVDSVGGADAEVRGILPASSTDNFNGTGQLVMSGGGSSAAPASAYVNVPNGLISGLSSVTMEGWLTYNAAAGGWVRWFDFGMSSGGPQDTNTMIWPEDSHGNPGRSYFFLARVGTGTELRFAIKEGEGPETGANFPDLVGGTYYHYAVVYDPANQGIASLYLNGQRVSETATSLALSVVDDRNNWLGRAQWTDGMLSAEYDEFRIWDGALLGADIVAAYAAGPGTVIVPIVPSAPPELIITEALPNVIVSWDTNATGFLLEAALDVTGPYSTNGLPAPSVVGGEFQVTVPATNDSRYFRLTD